MLQLNPNITVDDYIATWNNEKIVTIDNLLREEDANKLNEYLLNLSEEQWDVSIHPYDNKIFTFSNTIENRGHIIAGTKTANAANDAGLFSYCFRRHEGTIGAKELFSSPELMNLINCITNMGVKDIVTVFASMYNANSFLSTHTDTGRGKIAFVLNLTKNWDENNGGCFELLDKNWGTVRKKIIPRFNSLTIFNVENEGVPHRVTKVRSDVKKCRLAISGWFS